MSAPDRPSPEAYDESPVFEFTGPSDGKPVPPQTAEEILLWMLRRKKRNRPPLPDGYVPPPGIDIQELLKQLPERYRPKPE